MKAWLCLGSNLDNPFAQLNRALRYLNEKCYINLLRTSEAISTKPYGYADQPDFANQIIEIETSLKPEELAVFVKNAEADLGRSTTFKWGPRIIDIDILFCEDIVIKTAELTIPHIGIPVRGYLLKLLYDTIPDYVHPELNQTMSELYHKFLNQGDENV
jgi:2-amino-4-hydroxy-6-hydroxymethyldihydropteridine diphosphokinase